MGNQHSGTMPLVTTYYNASNTVVNFTSTKKRPSMYLFVVVAGIVFALLFLFKASLVTSILISIIYMLIFIFSRRNEVIEESVLVIKDFGVQWRMKYASGLEEIKFLERAKIERILIHEFIHGSSVCFALGFLVCESNLLVLAFKDVYPGLEFIKRVYLKCIEYDTVQKK
jgi:GPI-GlcNAc transferase complex, PIG-H component